jgi:hypothetical protein
MHTKVDYVVIFVYAKNVVRRASGHVSAWVPPPAVFPPPDLAKARASSMRRAASLNRSAKTSTASRPISSERK